MDSNDDLNQAVAVRAPLLILGWGNLSRGDDALGPLFLARLQASLPPALCERIEFLDDYQLQVEHALDMVGRQQVLFVDASLSCPPPFEVTGLLPVQDASFTTHTLSPQALMYIYRDVQGEPPPPCLQLAIRGKAFELGEPPGEAALAYLDAALCWALDALQGGVLSALVAEPL